MRTRVVTKRERVHNSLFEGEKQLHLDIVGNKRSKKELNLCRLSLNDKKFRAGKRYL